MITKKNTFLIAFFLIAFWGIFCCSDDVFEHLSNVYAEKHQENKEESAIQTTDDDVEVVFETEKTPLSEKNKFGEIEDIVKRGELVVCAKKDDNNVLFQVKTEDGDYIGKDVEFAKKMAKELGVRLRYRMIYPTYDDVVQAIQNGEGDIGIAKLSYTRERALKVMYSNPYVFSRHVFLINRVALKKYGNSSIQKLLNDDETKIGVVSKTAYESFVQEKFPEAQIVTDKDWEKVLVKQVAKNELIATVRDEVRIKSLLKKEPMVLMNAIPIAMKGEQETMSAIIRQGNVEFLCWVNRFLEERMPPDAVNDLMAKYGDTIK